MPTKQGVEGTLRYVPDGRVEVRVYGEPSWDTSKRTSPPPDQFDNVHVTFFTNKAELEAALASGGSLEDWVANQGGWNFQQVLAVSVAEG